MIYQGRRKAGGNILLWEDDFNGATLNARWTSPVTSTSPTLNTLSGGVLTTKPNVAGTASTGKRGAWGIREVAPSGNFVLRAKLKAIKKLTGNARCGIFVASTTTGLVQALGRQAYDAYYNVGNSTIESIQMNYSETADWANVAAQVALVNAYPADVFEKFEIRYNPTGGKLQFFYTKDDGVSWICLNQRNSIAVPNRIGAGVYSFDALVPADQSTEVDKVEVFSVPTPTGGYAETPIIESTSSFTGFPASNLFDGDYSTWWTSNANTFPITLTTKTTLARVVKSALVVSNRSDSYGGQLARNPRDFVFEGSNNSGATWDTLGSFSGVTWQFHAHERQFAMTTVGAYKWVRMRITAAQTGNDGHASFGQLIFSE